MTLYIIDEVAQDMLSIKHSSTNLQINKRQKIPKGQPKMNNPTKLATHGTHKWYK